MSRYTQQHYEQLARIVSEIAQGQSKNYLARRLAVVFTNDNKRFDADLWFKAVGVAR